MYVSGLFVHPLKSAAAIALETAELDTFGIRLDRRWLVVDAQGSFLTQRDVPALALVRTAFEATNLKLVRDGLPPLRLPLAGPEGPRRAVGIWGDRTEGIDCGEEAAAWISSAIGRPARVLHMADDTVRRVDPRYSSGGERVSFADGFPLLLLSQASLDGLNARLRTPLPMNRFRPNIVVSGTAPHEEDTWSRIRIGTVECAVVKPCARCVTTTIDQDTALAGREPLRTLATYRRDGAGVMFGQNVIHRGPGRITLGDPVVVIPD